MVSQCVVAAIPDQTIGIGFAIVMSIGAGLLGWMFKIDRSVTRIEESLLQRGERDKMFSEGLRKEIDGGITGFRQQIESHRVFVDACVTEVREKLGRHSDLIREHSDRILMLESGKHETHSGSSGVIKRGGG